MKAWSLQKKCSAQKCEFGVIFAIYLYKPMS